MGARTLGWLRRRASFANVVSLIALFISLGGASYAFTQLPANSVGQAQLKKNSVGSRQLRPNSTGSEEIKAAAVHVADLARNAVTAAALAPGAVTSLAMSPNAITQTALANNAVTAGALALGAVTPGALADNAVTSSKIASSAVGAAQVQDGTLAPQDFTQNGLPEVGYSSRELGSAPEALPVGASNGGVLNLDVPAGTSGYTSSSGVVGAVAPSHVVANAQIVLLANKTPTPLQCRLSLYHAGQGDQQPFAAGVTATGHNNEQTALPLAGGIDVEPGSYNVRVQCFTFPDPAGSSSFVRGSLTVSIAPR
jgi:hypothetical protein